MKNMIKQGITVDLIYLDPPFNSNRNYNLLYKNLTGQPVDESVEAFCDAWTLDAEKYESIKDISNELHDMVAGGV